MLNRHGQFIVHGLNVNTKFSQISWLTQDVAWYQLANFRCLIRLKFLIGFSKLLLTAIAQPVLSHHLSLNPRHRDQLIASCICSHLDACWAGEFQWSVNDGLEDA